MEHGEKVTVVERYWMGDDYRIAHRKVDLYDTWDMWQMFKESYPRMTAERAGTLALELEHSGRAEWGWSDYILFED